MLHLDINQWNNKLRNMSPNEIVDWALRLSSKRIVTTSFGKYSAVLLNLISELDKDITVVWCDTLYNSSSTYLHAEQLVKKYNLKVKKYQPLLEKDEIETKIGLPNVEESEHSAFSEVVKLEPFRRALKEQNPDVWFTNIRLRQTTYRNEKDILSYSKDGILKVSPFYYYNDADLDKYLLKNNLPKNKDYFDPIKALANRECGIHFQ